MTVAGVGDRVGWATRVRVWREAARPFVGIVVIGLWLVWAVLAWQVEPRTVDATQVRADIASGQILTYDVTATVHRAEAWPPRASGDGFDTIGLDETTGLPDDSHAAAATGVVYWVDAPYAQTRFFSAINSRNAGAPDTWEGLVAEMRAGGVPTELRDRSGLPYDDAPFFPGWAALLLGFGGVLLYYRPTRVNRWGWLWLVALVPFGLGLVALAATELVRPASPERPRMRGGRGFLLALATVLIVAVVAGAISRGSTSLWIP